MKRTNMFAIVVAQVLWEAGARLIWMNVPITIVAIMERVLILLALISATA